MENTEKRGAMSFVTFYLIKVVLFLYTVVTLPLYWLVQKPWRRLSEASVGRAYREDEKDPDSCWIRKESAPHHLVYESLTVDEVFSKAVRLYKDRKCLGFRKVLAKNETSFNGKLITRCHLSEYNWLSFREVDHYVAKLVKAFLLLGVKPKDMVLVFAETRFEWMVTAQAILRLGATLNTLFPSITEEGLVHGINELEVSVIVTSFGLLPKITSIGKQRLPRVATVIYFDSNHPNLTLNQDQFDIRPFSQFIESGREAPDHLTGCPPTPYDVAIIMYTSGSTGLPKGVVITHRNVLCLLRNIMAYGSQLNGEEDVYLGCLPLGHIGELAFESLMMSIGVPIGYSSSLTIADGFPGLMPGTPGDATLLKPTTAFLVPLILERIKKTILNGCDGKEWPKYLNQQTLWQAINYKKHWVEQGYQTPLVDRIVCQRLALLMGGKMRYILSGSSALSPQTENFINYGLNLKVVLSYGLTEVTCIATLQDPRDLQCHCVGYPAPGVKIRLVSWVEGGYRTTDRPHPRGEVVIGGEGVTSGYFKRDDLTREVYRKEGGETWFYSGDIGEMLPNGVLKIIDRKKDLVKQQDGLYVALGKVESTLKTCKYIENICVYGNGRDNTLTALIVPNQCLFKVFTNQIKKTFDELCREKAVVEFIEREVITCCRFSGLRKNETPKKVILCTDDWTPESGLVTAALKIKRQQVYQFYRKALSSVYQKCNNNNDPNVMSFNQ